MIGQLDVTREELASGLFQACRLAAVGLAFAVYALHLDHDELLGAARLARRSVLAVALATRLLPTLERDASGFVLALRGRGVEITGARGRAALLSPLLAGSLERGVNLAEAMEARGYGRAGRTRIPPQRWRLVDHLLCDPGELLDPPPQRRGGADKRGPAIVKLAATDEHSPQLG